MIIQLTLSILPALAALQRYAVAYGYQGMSREDAGRSAIRTVWVVIAIEAVFVIWRGFAS